MSKFDIVNIKIHEKGLVPVRSLSPCHSNFFHIFAVNKKTKSNNFEQNSPIRINLASLFPKINESYKTGEQILMNRRKMQENAASFLKRKTIN
jgi:hypothetical protein